MGIEIRPAAVMGQIGRKASLLGALLDEAGSKRARARGFAADGLLQGPGYAAAKERVASYGALFEALEASIGRTLQIDARVSSALSGYFGGCARVSEDEWLARQREAWRAYGRMESSLRWLRGLETRCYRSETLYADAMAAAEASASYAGDMLSKIYSYCAETDGLHAELDGLNACIARGCSALAASGYSPESGRWGKMDASWRGELAAKTAKVAGEVMLEESRADPGKAFLSGDRRYVYYHGRRWSIESPSDSEEPGLHAAWKRACEDLEIPFTEVEWARMLAGFGTDSAGGGVGGEGIDIADIGNASGFNFLSSVFQNATDSVEARKLTFRFEERPDGAGRVAILGKEPYPQGSVFFSDFAWKPGAHAAASQIYEQETGEPSIPIEGLYDIKCTFDPAREGEDSYTSVFYFGEDGSLQEQVVRYPGDEVQVVVGGLVPGADITDEFYSGAHGAADHAFAEKIRENVHDSSEKGQ